MPPPFGRTPPRRSTQAADGTQAVVVKALAGVPPLAEIITRLPVTPLTALPAARRSRPSLLRPLLVALALTALSIALSLAVTSIIRRRRASGGTPTVIPTAAAAPAPTKEPVAIPIDVAASPAPGEAWVPEAVEEPQAPLTDAPEAIPTEETSASLEGLAATNGAPERS